MSTRIRRHLEKIGASPGTLVYIGDAQEGETVIEVTDFNHEKLNVFTGVNPDEIQQFVENKETITWTHIAGLYDSRKIAEIGFKLGLNDLFLEDILNTDHPVKFEEFEGYGLVVIKPVSRHSVTKRIQLDHFGLILGDRFIITFQESSNDLFPQIKTRLQQPDSRIRKKGADYLAFAILDCIVDRYIEVIDDIRIQVEELEDRVFEDPERAISEEIHGIRRELTVLLNLMLSTREALGMLRSIKTELVHTKNDIFFSDLTDHIRRYIDVLEINRDLLVGIRDLLAMHMNNKMNEVMKVLTIIATVFIPITFVAGVYGMNFEMMPELTMPWGYPAALGVMGLIVGGMLFFFKSKKWL